MRRLTVLLLALLLPTALLAACGDDDDTGSDDPAVTDGGSDDGGTDDGAEPFDETEQTIGGSGDEAALEALLLTTGDLGAKWTKDPDDGDDDADDEADDDGPECLQEPDGAGEELAEATASFSFADADELPSFEESLSLYDADEIAHEFDLARDQADSCTDFDFTEDDLAYRGDLSRIDDFPTYGDESGAWKMHMFVKDASADAGDTEEIEFTALVVMARVGDVGVTLFEMDFGFGPDDFQELVDLAIAKIEAAA